MNAKYKCISEDNKSYSINFSQIKNNEKKIILFISDDSETNKVFISKYELEDLNTKFMGIIHLKSIHEFQKLLIENLKNKKVILKKPYKNSITSTWKLFPKDENKKNTFILLSSLDENGNITLMFYSDYIESEKAIKEIEKQAQAEKKGEDNELIYKKNIYDNWLIDDIYYLKEQYKDEKKKMDDFTKLYEKKKSERQKNEINRILLIFFDSEKLVDIIFDNIDAFLMDQIFILIFSNDIANLKSKINKRFEEFSEDDLAYFDMDNIFILNNSNEGYKKILMPILKVFRYFNQLGDSFFKQLPDLINMENYQGEVEHLFHTHYFNILLSGMTGTGKSTFINRIMGEKKSFTLKTKSAGTYRNNYYIHKKYPIKIIDVCGFAQGSEGDENKKKLQAVYKKNTDEIIIDEPMNDIFTFYGDKRNYIHLLLYFTSFRGKYDVIPGELPTVIEAMSHNIPIIFVVNKCPDDLFKEKSRALKTFEKEIKEVRKDPEQIVDFSNYKTFPINCITKKGFDKFLEGIYEQFKTNIIPANKMEGIKEGIVPQKELFSLFKNLFGEIKPEDVLLNESLINSVKDIKLLVVKIAAYYSNELGFWKSLGFYLFNKIYNNYKRDSETNFFPLLTDLIQKIYSNFGFDVTTHKCNDFVKTKLSQYFEIDVEFEKEKKRLDEKQQKFIEEKKKKEEKNNKEEKKDENGKKNKEENKGKKDEKKEEKEKSNKNINKKEEKNEEKGEAPPPMNYNSIRELHPPKNNQPRPYKFTIEKFKKDFINLGRLYWNSEENFKINEKIEKDYIKNKTDFEGKIFSFNEEDENEINAERILVLVRRDFGVDDSKREATSHEKIVQKLFYISYTCNELISELCGKINQNGFKYQSICNFYYTISESYNNAINGFMKIIEDIKGEDKDENDAAPHLDIEKTKD